MAIMPIIAFCPTCPRISEAGPSVIIGIDIIPAARTAPGIAAYHVLFELTAAMGGLKLC